MTTSIDPDFKFNPEVGKKEIVSVFDTLMETVKKHLQIEYDAQRLKGADYSKVYLGSMEAVLGNSVQYLIGMALTDEQKADIIAGTDQKEAQTRQINYVTDTQLPAQVKQTEAQTKQVNYVTETQLPAQVRQTNYQTDSVLPAQVNLTKAQETQTAAQTRQVNYVTDSQLPAQVDLTKAQKGLTTEQTEGAKYQRLNIMPSEKDKIVADTGLVKEQLEGAKYQRINIMPAEKDKIIADKNLVTEQNAGAAYQRQFIMPAEREEIYSRRGLNNAQTNLATAQTTKTNTEKTLIDEKKNTEVQQQKVARANRAVLLRQSKGYEIDFRIKTTKVVADIYSAGLVAAGNEAGFGYTTVTNRLSDIDSIVSQSDPLPAA